MCKICLGSKEMVSIFGNQPFEFFKVDCQCNGGEKMVGSQKNGFQLKRELKEYEEWKRSDSGEFMYEPDYYFANTDGYPEPEEVQEEIFQEERYAEYRGAEKAKGVKPLPKKKWLKLLYKKEN